MTTKYTGKERDAESGLDYFGARHYSSMLGRFMSPDWSDAPEPVPYADLTDPQSLNLYGYVRNNPMSRRDADGHTCDPDTWDPKTNTATAGACHPDPLLALAWGHHFIDQSLVRAKGAWNSQAGQFFQRWRTGPLQNPGLHRGYTVAHRLNSLQIKQIIARIESRAGGMSNWGEAEIKEAVAAVRGAGGDVKSFLADIEKNNPLARTVRDDVTSIFEAFKSGAQDTAGAVENAISEVQASPKEAIKDAIIGIGEALEAGEIPPL